MEDKILLDYLEAATNISSFFTWVTVTASFHYFFFFSSLFCILFQTKETMHLHLAALNRLFNEKNSFENTFRRYSNSKERFNVREKLIQHDSYARLRSIDSWIMNKISLRTFCDPICWPYYAFHFSHPRAEFSQHSLECFFIQSFTNNIALTGFHGAGSTFWIWESRESHYKQRNERTNVDVKIFLCRLVKFVVTLDDEWNEKTSSSSFGFPALSLILEQHGILKCWWKRRCRKSKACLSRKEKTLRIEGNNWMKSSSKKLFASDFSS